MQLSKTGGRRWMRGFTHGLQLIERLLHGY